MEVREEVVVRAALIPPRSLVPADAVENSSTDVLSAIFSPLVRVTGTGSLEPLVAAELPTTTDATTWTIQVSPGWTFHDGDPVDGQSFVDAWNFAAASTIYSGGFGFYEIAGFDDVLERTATTLSGVRLVDPMTIEVTLAAPDSTFPIDLAGLLFAPMSPGCLEDPAACEARPVGNGPFRLTEPWHEGAPLRLERFAEWNGPARPVADRLEIIAASDTDRLSEAAAGDLDLARLDPGGEAAQTSGDLTLVATPTTSLTSLVFAADDPRFADPEVRAAISMAIDRDALAGSAANGSALPASGLAPPTVIGQQAAPCGPACDYDPVAARSTLDAASGFAGTLPLTYSGEFGNEEAFDLLVAQLEDGLGIDVEPRPVDSAQLALGAGAIDEGLVALGWSADAPVAADLVARWSGERGREIGYSSRAVDDLMARARSAPTLDEGVRLVQEAERAVLADLPATPLWFRSDRWAVGSRLVGFELDGAGAPRWDLLGRSG